MPGFLDNPQLRHHLRGLKPSRVDPPLQAIKKGHFEEGTTRSLRGRTTNHHSYWPLNWTVSSCFVLFSPILQAGIHLTGWWETAYISESSKCRVPWLKDGHLRLGVAEVWKSNRPGRFFENWLVVNHQFYYAKGNFFLTVIGFQLKKKIDAICVDCNLFLLFLCAMVYSNLW